MHMWTSAYPAKRNWAEQERIHTTKRNKLEFRKVAQLVEIAKNLKLLGCGERSGGYVLPWGRMATLAEAQPEEYTHPVVDDEDEEDEPEPEEWGARAQSSSGDTASLRPRASAATRVGAGVGGHGFQPRCTFIRESDDDSIPATDIGLERGQRDASGGASGVARSGASGDAEGLVVYPVGSGVRGRTDGRERVGDEAGYHPMEGGGAESTEELHTQMDREEDQRLAQLQREWVGRDAYMAEQQRLRDLETGIVVPDARGVEHSVPTVPHPFAADTATPDTPVPETSPQGDIDSGSAMGGDLGASEYGDPAVSNAILGLCAAGMLQRDPPATQEPVPMDGDSGELDGGRRPDAEGDDGAGDPDRLAPAHSAGSGRSSHWPIGGDACGPVQGDADVDEAGGNMSLALVLRGPSPMAHEDPSHPAEGGGGVDEEGKGGIAHDRPDPVRADMEEGKITPGLLDPDELHRALLEDPISRGPAGSLRVRVRSPPLYTPLSPLYFGSPASLEREQQCSETIRATASGARTTRISPVTPPPPTTLHDTPTTITGSIAERGHMPSSSSPRLNTQQSLHRP
ncbi:hypothetical protein CBR_g4712 [Chara braunii]|uniref:Uncharacterized protein n=1 Tax=Chara braunii TaxID=69332 RepID=A0A388KIK5_CHABU|nr:hypothetical protein CBR_g4712 [Chara braunii]|eukprot:GBG69885.1 hypothetical protein CBR_g4712 [Chara braunii]